MDRNDVAEPETDERAFWALVRLRRSRPWAGGVTLAQFRDVVRPQAMLLRADPGPALATLPALLPPDPGERAALAEAVREVATAAGPPGDAAIARLERIAAIVGVAAG